jgi:hypothetical protein
VFLKKGALLMTMVYQSIFEEDDDIWQMPVCWSMSFHSFSSIEVTK